MIEFQDVDVNDMKLPVLASPGHCSTCDRDVEFVATNAWLRDHFFCMQCGSIPRERALMHVIDSHFPGWRDARIHESSPAGRGASTRLAKECPDYTTSQYFQGREPGSMVDGIRCENLESLTFPNESFDLLVTQDVLEHVFDPAKVFREIARTLKPGGMHIFTVPLVNKNMPSSRRARMDKDVVGRSRLSRQSDRRRKIAGND